MHCWRDWTCVLLVASACGVLRAGEDSGGYRGPERNGIHPAGKLLKAWPPEGPRLLWTYPRELATLWDEESHFIKGPGQSGDYSKLAEGKDVQIGVGMGFSCATVAGDAVFVTGNHFDKGQKNLYATALGRDGELRWTRKLAPGLKCGRYEGPRATPDVYGGNLYFESGNGWVYCLEAKTGETKWSLDTRAKYGNQVSGWGYNVSPVLTGDNLLLPIRRGSQSLIALNPLTGALAWGTKLPPDFALADSSPVVFTLGNRRFAAVPLARAFVIVDCADGKVVWQTERACSGITPVFKDGHLLVGVGADLHLWKLKPDADGVEEVWKTPGAVNLCQVVALGEYVFATKGKAVVALDFKTGREAARWDGEWEPRSLVAADGMLYLIESDNSAPGNGKGKYGEKGRILLLDPAPVAGKLRVTGTLEPPPGTKDLWVAPTLAAGRLFHRHGHLLAVYDLRETSEGDRKAEP